MPASKQRAFFSSVLGLITLQQAQQQTKIELN
jgi:hypothetical protein